MLTGLLTALGVENRTAAANRLLADDAALTGWSAGERFRLLHELVAPTGGAPPDAELAAIQALLVRFGAEISAEALLGLVERLPRDRRPVEVGNLVARRADRSPAAAILRAATILAVEDADHISAHRLLTRLGGADPSLATMGWIQRTRAGLEPEGTPVARIALLSSFTIDQLVPYLDHECRRLGLAPDIYLAPFNTWAREILDPASGLQSFDPDLAFLSVALDDLIPDLAGHPSAETLDGLEAEALERVLQAARQYAAWSGKPLVVHTFHSAYRGALGTLEGREGPSRQERITRLNSRLAEGIRALPRGYLLDVAEVLSRAGVPADAPKFRHLAAMRIPPAGMPALARACAGYVAPQKGLTRKCVVLDLDNTLWGGVIGEDGPHGIRLGATSPGSEFVEFQRFLATLPQRGILLAVCSKNNPDDALEVIRGHESMVLREDAFSAVRINWQPKPENLASIAEELNIGLDALVFVDDNPDERELMRQVLPQVLTVEMPRDPALYRSTVEELPELQAMAVTDEDRQRVGQYRANRQRDQHRVSADSLSEYLRSLEVSVAIGPVSAPLVPRVAQLFQKTNQFNVTTRRYDAADVARFAADAGWRCYTLKAGDRFGDHGLVAVALARTGPDAWTVDSFLMSCRVIGYGIETALMAVIAGDAADAGADRLHGEFIVTRKNVPARDIYERHGFRRGDAVDGVERWHLDLAPGAIEFPSWIQRTDS